VRWQALEGRAQVAELVDALASGASGRKVVEVRVFSWAPWGADTLTDQQMTYAASDVLYLHALMEKLDVMLEREGRTEMARACFEFLPHRAALDLAGWPELDIFAH
jgi:hypothetical protein